MSRKSALKRVRVYALSCLVLALACFVAIPLSAQTVTGTILGNVLDGSGSAVPNVEITITNQDTGVARTVVSTAEGGYNVPSLLPGKYMVEGKAQGFSPVQVKDVTLNVGSNAQVNLVLQVGQVSQSVTVTEAAPTVETTSSEVSQLMDENLIKDIPLNARDIQQLAVIQPGVQLMNTSGYGGKAMSAAGDRPINNRFLQEGIDLTTTYRTSPYNLASSIMLGVEAVKEFKVLSTNLPAEYGEQSGGTVNTLFKSGGNGLHGSGYEYYRNSTFDAKNYFDTTAETPPLHRHQFGVSFSGPIRKDKTFFFANYEGLRQDQAQTFTAFVPDANARNGIINGAPIPNFSATVQRLFFGGANPLYPTCNGPSVGGGLCTYQSNPVDTTSENYGLVKIDHSFSSKNTLSSSFNIDRGWRVTPNSLQSNADDRVNNRNTFTLQDTHLFSSNVVNTARFGINRTWYNDQKDIIGLDRVDPSILPIKLAVPCATVCSDATPSFPSGVTTPVPTIAISGGMTGYGGTAKAFDFAPRWIGYTTALLSDDVNYLRGNHAFQFGGQLKRWYDNIAQYRGTPLGSWSFASLTQFLQGGPAQTFSFDLQTATSSYGRFFSQHLFALYAQDTYKLKSNLTINYGLRWEYVPGPGEKNGKLASLSNPTPLTATAPLIGKYFDSSKRNFAPRVGFNWDPFKKGKTSVRAGFGIFFNEIEDSTYFTTGTNQYPFVTSVTLSNLMSLPFSQSILDTQVAKGLALPNFGTFEPNPKTPTKYSYNFTFQQELPQHIGIMLAYVGATQRHQGRQYSVQEYAPTTYEVPGQLPMVNGVPIPGSAINPNCVVEGSITCAYWAGAGLSNANVLGNLSGTNGATGNTVPYATLCGPNFAAGGANKTNCFNNPNFGNTISSVVFDAGSSYNAFQATVERRMSPGLFVRFNYTLAYCEEDASDDLAGGEANGGGAAWSPTTDPRANRHRCSFTGLNAANLSITYDLPFGRMFSSGWGKQAFGGWQITTLTTIQSGVPFDVRLGANVARASNNGNGNGHPDVVAGCDENNMINVHNPNNYVKASCLSAGTPGYLGNMGPLMLTAPATVNTDVSLKKNIAIRESKTLTLSADMFNAFNRVNFASPASTTAFNSNGTTPNTTLGVITSTIGTSRQFQLGARFQF